MEQAELEAQPAGSLVVDFAPVNEVTVEQLKTLNRAIFPVKYQDSIYRQCIQAGDTTQLAFQNQVLIGAIACRLEADQAGGARVYIVSLGVLAPYRNLGIGTQLLQRALAQARTDSNIAACYLHVQVSNKDAIRFYTRQGFAVGPVVTNYYRRIEPRDAVVLSKSLC